MRSINRPKRQKRRVPARYARTSAGAYLIELLVALVLGAGFAYAMTNMLSQAYTVSTSTQNNQYANIILDELREYVRAESYDFFESQIGLTKELKISSMSNTGEIRKFQRFEQDTESNPASPLLLVDERLGNWEDKSKNGAMPTSAKASYEVLQETDEQTGRNYLRIVLTVSWADSRTSGNGKSISSSVVKFR